MEEVLGLGATAIVYRARSTAGPPVALKLVDRRRLADETAGRRIAREAELLASFDHPGIVKILDHGADGDALYLALELVEGPTLAELVARRSLSLTDTARIVIDLADALDAAHGAGIVHRDVKPENVLLRAGRAVLTDFGIARLEVAPPTRVGGFVGSARYAAPEQIRGEAVGASADVYALAALAWTCLTGRGPFDHDVEAAILHGHLHEPPPPLPGPGTPGGAALLEVLHRGLAKDPGTRPADAGTFARALGRAVEACPPATRDCRPAFAATGAMASTDTIDVPAAPAVGRVGATGVPTGRSVAVAAADAPEVVAPRSAGRALRRVVPVVAGSGVVGLVAVALWPTTPVAGPGAPSVLRTSVAALVLPAAWRAAPAAPAPLRVTDARTLIGPGRTTVSLGVTAAAARTATPATALQDNADTRIVEVSGRGAFLTRSARSGRPVQQILVVPGGRRASVAWCSGVDNAACSDALGRLRPDRGLAASALREVGRRLDARLRPVDDGPRVWSRDPGARDRTARASVRRLRLAAGGVRALASEQHWDPDLRALTRALDAARVSAGQVASAARAQSTSADRSARAAWLERWQRIEVVVARLDARYALGALHAPRVPALRSSDVADVASAASADASPSTLRSGGDRSTSAPSSGSPAGTDAGGPTAGSVGASGSASSRGADASPERGTSSTPGSSGSGAGSARDAGEPVVVSAPL